MSQKQIPDWAIGIFDRFEGIATAGRAVLDSLTPVQRGLVGTFVNHLMELKTEIEKSLEAPQVGSDNYEDRN